MTIKGSILVGTIGQGVMMSADDGESWTRASVRQGMHSRYGYLYRSDDGGETWRKLWREFGEVSSLLWVPRS